MTSPSRIDFYFDFISPYGYFASLRINQLGVKYGIPVVWHPVLIGVTVIKIMGMKPLMETPLKKDYIPRELARYSRLHGVEIHRDPAAPSMNPLRAARAFAWLLAHAPEYAQPFAVAALDAYWRENRELSLAEQLLAAAARAGLPESIARHALEAEDASTLLKNEVDQAISRGVFGSPFFLVDDEPFFGVDKMELLDHWLARGGW